jgi:hypothetical protein
MQKQQELIEHFNQQMEDAKSDAFSHSETPSQTDEGSNSPGDLLNVMRQELDFVQYEMSVLVSIDPNDDSSHAERGAVVVTDRRTFFIGVSSEEIEVDGAKIFGMSERAPLYGVMKGLSKGSSFEFNKTKYQIEDIY